MIWHARKISLALAMVEELNQESKNRLMEPVFNLWLKPEILDVGMSVPLAYTSTME